jgi:hypothetical protein
MPRAEEEGEAKEAKEAKETQAQSLKSFAQKKRAALQRP